MEDQPWTIAVAVVSSGLTLLASVLPGWLASRQANRTEQAAEARRRRDALRANYVKFMGMSRDLGDQLANQGRSLAEKPTLALLEKINEITDEIELSEPDYTIVELVEAMRVASSSANEDVAKQFETYSAKSNLLRVKLRRRYAVEL